VTSANTAADDYTYVSPAAPTVSGLNPDHGPTSGGTTVTITGTNLSGASAVAFGTTTLTTGFTVDSATQITVTAPSHTAGTVDVRVTVAGVTSANTGADDYEYVQYDLVVVKGDTVQGYTLSDLQGLSSVSGYGGFLNTFPSFKGPWSFTGVSVLSLLADVGGLPAGHNVKVTASDNYAKTFTYDQVKNNNFTMYDPTSDPANPTVIGPGDITGSLEMVVAYEQDGGPISDGGPLRLVFLSPVEGEQATDSVNWVKYVVKIEVL
jgi:hypothetical protein